MWHLHCTECCHEWDVMADADNSICDWCGAAGYCLGYDSSFEDAINLFNFKLRNKDNERKLK